MISDKDKNIIVNVQGSNLTVEFGQDMEADVIGKMSKETFDRIVQGRITFHTTSLSDMIFQSMPLKRHIWFTIERPRPVCPLCVV